MTLVEVLKINTKNDWQCWGCNNLGESDKFCELRNKYTCRSICMKCYETNIDDKLKQCINCDGNFILDFTKLKINDKITYGFDEFVYCYECLNTTNKFNKKCAGFYAGLDCLENENSCTVDYWLEEIIEPNYKHYYDKQPRIIGQTMFYFKEEKYKIKKKIDNCIRNDIKNFKIKGNITYEHICELLKLQKYECYICWEKVLTCNYKPYCCNQFSIDRIDNKFPHNINNIRISCYFCNCKNHYLYDKTEKKCDIIDCNCQKFIK